MAEPVSKAPPNKKADDDAIRTFVADSETGVIAPEVAEAFDLGKTTARERLSRLENRGEISSRKASVIRLFYVPRDDREHGANDEEDTASEPTPETDDSGEVFGSVEFLTDVQRAYLRDGTLDETTEPDILGGLREHLAETLWQTPCIDGFDREEIELLARRLDIPSEEVPALTPNELFERLDELAVNLGTPIDRLYSTVQTPSVEVLRWVRREKLDRTQSEIAERLAEVGDLSQSGYMTRLSQLESGNKSISEDDRARLAGIYRDIYAEDHDPYQIREEWDWPGTSESNSENLPSAIHRVDEADSEEKTK